MQPSCKNKKTGLSGTEAQPKTARRLTHTGLPQRDLRDESLQLSTESQLGCLHPIGHFKQNLQLYRCVWLVISWRSSSMAAASTLLGRSEFDVQVCMGARRKPQIKLAPGANMAPAPISTRHPSLVPEAV
jgi:hypothetical protein